MLAYRLSCHPLRCALLLASLTLGACSDSADNSANTTPAQSFSGVITGPLASIQKWREEGSLWSIAPSDRLIIGPIVINKTWTTVTLQEPLTTLPNPHDLHLLMAKDLYVAGDDFHNRSPGDPNYSEESWIELKRLSDGAILANKDMWPARGHPQAIDIILIDSQGGETPLPRLISSGGRIKTLQGEFHLLSYTLFTPDYIPLGSFLISPKTRAIPPLNCAAMSTMCALSIYSGKRRIIIATAVRPGSKLKRLAPNRQRCLFFRN